MKIRQGFVSNSSSSSYIIKVTDSEKCPTCGRQTPNIIDHIGATDCDETSIQYDSKEQIIGEIDAEIHRCKRDIEEYSIMDPNIVPPKYREWSTTTVREWLERAHKDLKYCRDRRDKIAVLEGNIYGIEISYHDSYTQEVFNSGVKDGSIEVIEE